MRSTTLVASAICLAGVLSLLRSENAAGAVPTIPPAFQFSYYGIAQNLQLASGHDYLASIATQGEYSNTVALGFVHSRGQVVSPTPTYLQAVAAYDLAVLNLGRTIWKETRPDRQLLFTRLKNTPGFDAIDALVVIDEPYLGGYTPPQLSAMIQEVHLAFAGRLQLIVNFNPRGFFPSRTNYQVPAGLDFVSFNVYPTNFGLDDDLPGASTRHEKLWKEPIAAMADFLRTKTSTPLLLVAQGFSTGEFRLQPYHVDWSVEVADAKQLTGVVFWFSEPLRSADKVGFSHISTQMAAQRIREWGLRTLH